MTTTLAFDPRPGRRSSSAWTRRRRSRYAWVDALVTSAVIVGFALALGVMAGESLGEAPAAASYASAPPYENAPPYASAPPDADARPDQGLRAVTNQVLDGAQTPPSRT